MSSDEPARAAADAWGRVPGMAPPLPAWAPLAFALALAVTVSAVVLALVRPPGPLDQPDPANQRDGLLQDGPRVPAQVLGVGFGGRPVVLVFDRQVPAPAAFARWRRGVPGAADVRLVLPAPPAATAPPAGTVVDPGGRLARAVALPTPVDGGPGVGYAVVDAGRTVRYATLDPQYLDNAFEVATIVGAVR